MKDPSGHLSDLKNRVTEALLERGFELETFNIEIEEDENHTARLRVKIIPEALKDDEELKIDESFIEIIKGLGL